MYSATLFIFFALLTSSNAFAALQAAPEPPALMHASEATIESLEYLHEKAETQIIRNDFPGAIRTYSDILLIEPDDESAYEGLGHCYLLLGQYQKANEAYRNALSINPENQAAILGIQKIMDPDGVEGMMHEAQVDPESFDLFDSPAIEPSFGVEDALETPLPATRVPPAPRKTEPVKPAKAQVVVPASQKPMPAKPAKAQVVVPAAQPAKAVKREAPKSIALLKPLKKYGRLDRLDAEYTAPLPLLPTVVVKKEEPILPVFADANEPAKPLPIAEPEKPKTDSQKTAKPANFAAKPLPKAKTKAPVQKTAAPPVKPATQKTASVPAQTKSKGPSIKPVATSAILDVVDAREIQKALRHTGFYSGPIDGILGPGSRKAVKDYQVLHELKPDGVVGERTWASLRLYLDPSET